MQKNRYLMIHIAVLFLILLSAAQSYAELPAKVWWSGYSGDTDKGVMWYHDGHQNERFNDNGDGTITDTLTGLIWLQDASCLDNALSWDDALDKVSALNQDPEGSGCGLSDTTIPQKWRLPNKTEMISLIDYGKVSGLRVATNYFSGVSSFYYWTSTSYLGDPDTLAWIINYSSGEMIPQPKTTSGIAVWAVSGGLIPELEVDNDPYDFGEVLDQSEKVFTITSVGTEDLIINSVTLGGVDASNFSLSSNNCNSTTLSQGENCTFTVTFSPESIGPKTAYLAIDTNVYYYYDSVTEKMTKYVDLSGTGTVELSVTADQGGCQAGGRVTEKFTAQPRIDCGVNVTPIGNDCNETFGSTEEIILEAIAATGSEFHKWEGCPLATDNTCTIQMNVDRNVIAFFKEIFTIDFRVKDGDAGKGSISPVDEHTFSCGEDVVFTCDPSEDQYEVSSIEVDGEQKLNDPVCIKDQDDSVTCTVPPFNGDVICGYKVKEFTLDIIPDPVDCSVITPSGPVTVLYNSNQNFHITFNECYELDELLDNGVSRGLDGSNNLILTGIKEDHTINVNCKKKTYNITTMQEPDSTGTVIIPSNPSVVCGESQQFEVHLAPGYQVEVVEPPLENPTIENDDAGTAELVVNEIDNCSVRKYTINDVKDNLTLKVILEEGTYYTVKTSVISGEGWFRPDGISCIPEGESQLFKIVPDDENGYCLYNLKACEYHPSEIPETTNCVDNGSDAYIYSIENIQKNWLLEASFDQPIGGCDLPVITPSITRKDDEQSDELTCDGSCGSITPAPDDDGIPDENKVIPGDSTTYEIIAREDNDFLLNYIEICTPDSEGQCLTISEIDFSDVPVSLNDDESVTCNKAEQQPGDGTKKYECTFNNVLGDHTIKAVMRYYPTKFITATYDSHCGESVITPSGHGWVVAQDANSITLRVPLGGSEAVTCVPDVESNCGISIMTVDDEPVENIPPLYQSALNYNFVNLQADRTIHCGFEDAGASPPLLHIITSSVHEDSAGKGIIIPEGNVPVLDGGAQDFIIIPAEGYYIDDVIIDGTSVGPVESYIFDYVDSDFEIEVSFKDTQNSFIIGSSVNGEKGIIVPEGDTEVPYLGIQEYTIDCKSGYYVDDVQVDGQSVGAPLSYVFTNVDRDHIITLMPCVPGGVFKYRINKSIEGEENGDIYPSGENGYVEVIDGQGQTFTIIPDPGFHIADVKVDNVSVGAISQYTFTDVSENHSIKASFELGSSSVLFSNGESANPGSHDFGDVYIYSTKSDSFILYNNGSSFISIYNIKSGEESEFTVPDGTNTCKNKILAPSDFCSFEVQFSPTKVGTVEKNLTILTSNLLNPVITTTLNGSGLLVGTTGSEITVPLDDLDLNPTLLYKRPKTYLTYINLKGKLRKAGLKAIAYDENEATLVVKKLPKNACEYNHYNSYIKFKVQGSLPIERNNFYAVPAVIDDGDPIEAKNYEIVKITGNYFGTKKKKVMLYRLGMMKPKKVKVLTWIMDPQTGRSEITFQVPPPTKIPPGTYDLIIDNKVCEPAEKEGFIIVN